MKKERNMIKNSKMKYIFAIIVALIVVMTPFNSVTAMMKGSFTIKPSTQTWTNKDIVLDVTSSGVDMITLGDGTIVKSSRVSYTVTKNGTYNFIGTNSNGDVTAISSYVVTQIDRVKKKGSVTPDDNEWRNKDVEVKVKVTK